MEANLTIGADRAPAKGAWPRDGHKSDVTSVGRGLTADCW